MTAMEDWDLARSAAEGDRDAFAALVNRYRQPVIRFCYRMAGSMADAEDVAQETFVNLYRSLGRLRREHAFSTVVFCYARNAILNHLRGAGRRRRHLQAFHTPPSHRCGVLPPGRVHDLCRLHPHYKSSCRNRTSPRSVPAIWPCSPDADPPNPF